MVSAELRDIFDTPSMHAFKYVNNEAPTDPRAKALAKRLNIDLSERAARKPGGEGLTYYIRRLIMTGQDTEENLRLLFGPS